MRPFDVIKDCKAKAGDIVLLRSADRHLVGVIGHIGEEDVWIVVPALGSSFYFVSEQEGTDSDFILESILRGLKIWSYKKCCQMMESKPDLVLSNPREREIREVQLELEKVNDSLREVIRLRNGLQVKLSSLRGNR